MVFTKRLGLDDYFIALALIVVAILAAFNGFQISWGAGCVPLLLVLEQTNSVTEQEDQTTTRWMHTFTL